MQYTCDLKSGNHFNFWKNYNPISAPLKKTCIKPVNHLQFYWVSFISRRSNRKEFFEGFYVRLPCTISKFISDKFNIIIAFR